MEKTKIVHEASVATSDTKTYLVAKRRDGNPPERDEYLSAITEEVKHKMKAEKAVTVDWRRTEIIQKKNGNHFGGTSKHTWQFGNHRKEDRDHGGRCVEVIPKRIYKRYQKVSKGINMVKGRRHLWCLTKGQGWDRNRAEEG